jgi:hypothetical protein
MAKQILRDVQIKVKGVDLTDHLQQVGVPTSADEQDVTAMGAKNKQTLLGIGDGEISATFFQDFAAGSVAATLDPLVGENEPFPVVVIPNAGAVSATNPAYAIAEAILPSLNRVSGSVGSAASIDCAFKNSGQGGVVKLTKPEDVEDLEEGA